MTIQEIAEKMDFTLLAGAGGGDHEVTDCYIGDLLSWVMAKCKAGDLWLTVMGNVNAVAVAALTDAAGVVLVEGAALDEAARLKADQQEIPVYSCPENSWQTALKLDRQIFSEG